MNIANPKWESNLPTSPGWDGCTAKPPTPEAIKAAKEFIAGKWHIAPRFNGGIAIEQMETGALIDIGPDGKVELETRNESSGWSTWNSGKNMEV